MRSTLAIMVLVAHDNGAAAFAPGHARLLAAQPRRSSILHANFFSQAAELVKYKAKHVGTMCTVQHVVVGSLNELNACEEEVKAAGSTEEAMAACAAKYSLDKQSASQQGVVGPFMLGQKEYAFEKTCFDGDQKELLGCKSSMGYHLIKVLDRGTCGPDGKIIEPR
jgi:hypothetical protein